MYSSFEPCFDTSSSKQCLHYDADKSWDDIHCYSSPLLLGNTHEEIYAIAHDTYPSLPYLRIPHGNELGVLRQETLSPIDRCTTSSSLSSASCYDLSPPSYQQDVETPDSSSQLCTPFGDAEQAPIRHFDQILHDPSIYPFYDSNQYDGLSAGYGRILVKASPDSSLQGALGDPDGHALDSHRRRPDFAWSTPAHVPGAAYTGLAPSADYPTKRPRPPQSASLSRATSSISSHPSVISTTSSASDPVRNPTDPCRPSLCSEPPSFEMPAAPELHHPRPVRHIPLKQFMFDLDAFTAHCESERWDDSTLVWCQPPHPPEFQSQFVHPEEDYDMDLDDGEGDDEDECIDDVRPPLALEIEVGPSIGLGSGPRTLDPGSLLLQPISEAVKSQYLFSGAEPCTQPLGDRQNAQPEAGGRASFSLPGLFTFTAQPGSCCPGVVTF